MKVTYNSQSISLHMC